MDTMLQKYRRIVIETFKKRSPLDSLKDTETLVKAFSEVPIMNPIACHHRIRLREQLEKMMDVVEPAVNVVLEKVAEGVTFEQMKEKENWGQMVEAYIALCPQRGLDVIVARVYSNEIIKHICNAAVVVKDHRISPEEAKAILEDVNRRENESGCGMPSSQKYASGETVLPATHHHKVKFTK